MRKRPLHNIYSKEILQEKLNKESFRRITLSFYRYVRISDPESMRSKMYEDWEDLGILGRIYLAEEGINAQLSVPEENFSRLRTYLDSTPEFQDVPFKIAVEDDGKSFFKLHIKVKKKIVADGLDDDQFDVTNVGTHVTGEQFNQLSELPDSIVVDVRNHYESEIGHFEKAILPQSDTFREELPMLVDLLKDEKDKKILMYCTGGIRCEKASAYLRHHGFDQVYQLYGGIISYASEMKEKGIPSKFRGKNFVFDDRLQETIDQEIISTCHQCDDLSARHVNCANPGCHILFIQCEKCATKFDDCCSEECQEIHLLPQDEQRRLRKGKDHSNKHFSKSRIRPKVFELYRAKAKAVE
ncbi:hypothetical protein CH373_08785 [Leptospira perolatii]|uniref:tRNA uridine(34) hydroxylase n=1 Tax=Leptospira perolatii TaxID=2023191 RepID=A0A2M9ZNS5_9LEPT|nr:rhodanese-related sulfurtransferase [Leptospira perolatii]PJZ69596.1 hypothetical protein CH360_09930 [Leptospira perolatii]PJZ73583.1 hypothetical protein CH373_08785 [Leptospira perolatii]